MKRWKIAALLAGALLIGAAFAGCSANLSKSGSSETRAGTGAAEVAATTEVSDAQVARVVS